MLKRMEDKVTIDASNMSSLKMKSDEIDWDELYSDEEVNGFCCALASEKSLAETWLTKEEDKAWAYLEEET